ncbi:MAG: hypothetical protein ACLQDY_18785 [Streptosporangiaceae bacterium]
MPTAAVASGDPSIHNKRAHHGAWAAMHVVADGLTGQGLDILGQEWEEAFYLKATNAWGALCEATVGPNELFRWEYRSADGGWTDPAQIAVMTMILLGADNAAEACNAPSLRYPAQSFKSAVGLTARAHGMHARLAHVIRDDEFLEISAEVEITNPSQPGRGRVLARNSAICWECTFAQPNTGDAGLDATEIVETIGRSVPQLKVVSAQCAWRTS